MTSTWERSSSRRRPVSFMYNSSKTFESTLTVRIWYYSTGGLYYVYMIVQSWHWVYLIQLPFSSNNCMAYSCGNRRMQNNVSTYNNDDLASPSYNPDDRWVLLYASYPKHTKFPHRRENHEEFIVALWSGYLSSTQVVLSFAPRQTTCFSGPILWWEIVLNVLNCVWTQLRLSNAVLSAPGYMTRN